MASANARRMEMEQQIVTSAVRELLGHGYAISVHYGDNEYGVKNSTDETAILKALHQSDEEGLIVRKDGRTAEVVLVYGNDGYDVIADNSISLNEMLAKTTALASRLEDEEFGNQADEMLDRN